MKEKEGEQLKAPEGYYDRVPFTKEQWESADFDEKYRMFREAVQGSWMKIGEYGAKKTKEITEHDINNFASRQQRRGSGTASGWHVH